LANKAGASPALLRGIKDNFAADSSFYQKL
jgi:hypothetical protein